MNKKNIWYRLLRKMCNMYANKVKKKEIGNGVGRLTFGNGVSFRKACRRPLLTARLSERNPIAQREPTHPLPYLFFLTSFAYMLHILRSNLYTRYIFLFMPSSPDFHFAMHSKIQDPCACQWRGTGFFRELRGRVVRRS